MSNTDKDKEFYEMADGFIALANQQGENVDKGKVSATFLYAAARFNTFIAASGSDGVEDFAASKEKAIEYFMSEYKKMLVEHFENYHEHFDQYIGSNTNKTIN